MASAWKNPLANWGVEGAVETLPAKPWKSPQTTWDEVTQSRVPLYEVGRLRYYYKLPGHGARLWSRLRYWPTRRRALDIRGEYNPKSKRREKTIVDKRPIWWVMALVALFLAPLFFPDSMQSTLLTAGAIFLIYTSINLCWMLIIGTAGIYSLASYAVVGASAFGTAYLSIHYGLPWYTLPFIGSVIGLL